MAVGDRILWYGEIFTIVGEASEIHPSMALGARITLFVAINKEESAGNKSIQRATWVPYEHTRTLISSFDFRQSEWFLGVFNASV